MNKRFLLQLMTILMVTVFSMCVVSCGSDDDDDNPTSYTLKWNFKTYAIDNVRLFEYSQSGDKLNNHKIENLTTNGSYKFIATGNAAKVKVYFEISSSPRWVQQVFYLDKGSNIDIVVEDNTTVGRSEP